MVVTRAPGSRRLGTSDDLLKILSGECLQSPSRNSRHPTMQRPMMEVTRKFQLGQRHDTALCGQCVHHIKEALLWGRHSATHTRGTLETTENPGVDVVDLERTDGRGCCPRAAERTHEHRLWNLLDHAVMKECRPARNVTREGVGQHECDLGWLRNVAVDLPHTMTHLRHHSRRCQTCEQLCRSLHRYSHRRCRLAGAQHHAADLLESCVRIECAHEW